MARSNPKRPIYFGYLHRTESYEKFEVSVHRDFLDRLEFDPNDPDMRKAVAEMLHDDFLSLFAPIHCRDLVDEVPASGRH